jgi:N-acetylneuraminic acid mutarotase
VSSRVPRTRLAWLAGAAVLGVLAFALLLARGDGEHGAAAAATERWRALARSTVARTEVAAARIGDHAYVVGGFVPPGGATTDVVERYDLRRDRWTRVQPIPQAVNHAAAAAYRGDLYVVGGYASAHGLAGETDALWRYDPAADRWTKLRSAPTARGALAAGVVGDRLYVAGGARGGTALATLEIYDLRRRRWSRGPSLPTAREHLAGAVHGGAFYVLAGRAGGLNNVRVAERYVPARRRWERLPPMRKARSGIAAATVSGRVVVVGGEESAGTIVEVESFDPRTRRWRSEPRLPTPRHGLGAVAYRGQVLVLAGGPTPGLDYSDVAEALRVAR